MPGFSYGGGGNSIGGNSQFGNMGPNDPYGNGDSRGSRNGNGGGNGGGSGNRDNNNNAAAEAARKAAADAAAKAAAEAARKAAADAAAKAAAEAAARQAAEQAARQAAAEQAARQAAAEQAARQAAAEQAAREEAARLAQIQQTKEEQTAERDKAIAGLEPGVNLGSRLWGGVTSAFSGLGNLLGFGDEDEGRGTVGGALSGGLKWGSRGFSTMGPVGGILGALGGMIYGAGVTDKMTLGSLRGYNPNGEGGVTSAGDLASRQGNFWNENRAGGSNTGNGSGSPQTGNKPVSTPQPPINQPTNGQPVDKQAQAAINQLLPQTAKDMLQAGQQEQNQYLRALHGRYAKYALATGADGSGTSLLGRTAGGQNALGGLSGRTLLGGNT